MHGAAATVPERPMPAFEPTPTPLIRALTRILIALCAVSALLSASATPADGGACATEASVSAGRTAQRPVMCDYFASLGLDFLNDTAVFPSATAPSFGSIAANHLAAFKVYGLTEDPRFFADITFDTAAIKFRVRSPEGSAPARGHFIFSRTSNTFYFSPGESTTQDRVVFIEAAYHCTRPTAVYRTQFTLTILGSEGAAAPDAAEAANGIPSVDAPPDNAGPIAADDTPCADLALGVSNPELPVRLGDPFTAVVTIRNEGTTAFTNSLVKLNTMRPITVVASRYSAYPESWRSQRLTYYPGRLEPGEEATLTLSGYTWHSGTMVIPIEISLNPQDCNRANDRVDVRVEVTPDVPDLEAEWSTAALVYWRDFPRSDRAVVRGALRVSNDGHADAAQTRMAVFLSRDEQVGPEDRLLGFWDIPPIPAGGAASVSINRELSKVPGRGALFLIALLDSSNSTFELDERNNLAASQRVR